MCEKLKREKQIQRCFADHWIMIIGLGLIVYDYQLLFIIVTPSESWPMCTIITVNMGGGVSIWTVHYHADGFMSTCTCLCSCNLITFLLAVLHQTMIQYFLFWETNMKWTCFPLYMCCCNVYICLFLYACYNTKCLYMWWLKQSTITFTLNIFSLSFFLSLIHSHFLFLNDDESVS